MEEASGRRHGGGIMGEASVVGHPGWDIIGVHLGSHLGGILADLGSQGVPKVI